MGHFPSIRKFTELVSVVHFSTNNAVLHSSIKDLNERQKLLTSAYELKLYALN